VRLEGAPYDRHRLDEVPLASYGSPLFTRGRDGTPWAVGPYYSDIRPEATSAVCVRLEAPVSYVEVEDLSRIGAQALYRFDTPLDLLGALDLVRFHPDGGERRFAVPRTSDTILESDDGRVLGLIGDDGVELVRTDGGPERFVRTPRFDKAHAHAGGLLDPSGAWLLTLGYDYETVFLHDTGAERDFALGVAWTDGLVPAFDDANGQVVFCGRAGLVAAPTDGGPARVLDPTPCTAISKDLGVVLLHRNWAYYRAGGVLEAAALDRSAPPRQIAPGDADVLALGSGRAAVTGGAPRAWAGQASEGWLEGRRFMERGSHVSFSVDGARLRWLEHAADEDAVGELRSIAVADLLDGKPSLLLARNVAQYAELDDGRLLAVANRAFEGQQSRLEVIDEQARIARPIVTGAKRFVRVPGDRQVLVTLVAEQPAVDDVTVVAPVEAR
jgi:hypothetical protein